MSDWATLRARIQTISRPVRIVVATRDRSHSLTRSALDLLLTLTVDTPQLDVVVKDGPDPLTITLEAADRCSPIRFWGVPSGFELAALVEALLIVGSGRTELAALPEEVQRLVESIPTRVDADLYVAPT